MSTKTHPEVLVTHWEYCYVNESFEPKEGGGLRRELFIARPDRAETRDDLAPNALLVILGSEGWDLVSVVGVQTQYSEGPRDMGGIPVPSQVLGSSNTSSTTYYFKRQKTE